MTPLSLNGKNYLMVEVPECAGSDTTNPNQGENDGKIN